MENFNFLTLLLQMMELSLLALSAVNHVWMVEQVIVVQVIVLLAASLVARLLDIASVLI